MIFPPCRNATKCFCNLGDHDLPPLQERYFFSKIFYESFLSLKSLSLCDFFSRDNHSLLV